MICKNNENNEKNIRVRPCKVADGRNVNICVAEGCMNDWCLEQK